MGWCVEIVNIIYLTSTFCSEILLTFSHTQHALKNVNGVTIGPTIGGYRTQGLTHPLGRQGKHVQLILRELSMKAG